MIILLPVVRLCKPAQLCHKTLPWETGQKAIPNTSLFSGIFPWTWYVLWLSFLYAWWILQFYPRLFPKSPVWMYNAFQIFYCQCVKIDTLFCWVSPQKSKALCWAYRFSQRFLHQNGGFARSIFRFILPMFPYSWQYFPPAPPDPDGDRSRNSEHSIFCKILIKV